MEFDIKDRISKQCLCECYASQKSTFGVIESLYHPELWVLQSPFVMKNGVKRLQFQLRRKSKQIKHSRFRWM